MSEQTKEQIVAEISRKLVERINASTEAEVKKDFAHIATSIVEFVAMEDPTILNKGLEESQYIGKFVKLISGVAMDAINPFKRALMEKKFTKFTSLFPVIQKYLV